MIHKVNYIRRFVNKNASLSNLELSLLPILNKIKMKKYQEKLQLKILFFLFRASRRRRRANRRYRPR